MEGYTYTITDVARRTPGKASFPESVRIRGRMSPEYESILTPGKLPCFNLDYQQVLFNVH